MNLSGRLNFKYRINNKNKKTPPNFGRGEGVFKNPLSM